MNIEPGIKQAIEVVGGQERLARVVGLSQSALSRLLNKKIRPNAETAIAIERATQGLVIVEELRPDLIEHWNYIRGTAKRDAEHSESGEAA